MLRFFLTKAVPRKPKGKTIGEKRAFEKMHAFLVILHRFHTETTEFSAF